MDKKQIEHIAKLSRLDISDIENLNEGISNVIDMMDKLNELDFSHEEALECDGKTNSFREDVVVCEYNPQELLKNAPEFEAGGVSVPKVVE